MQFTLSIDTPALPSPIVYTDNILLIGSCFTEHMSDQLQRHRFHICNNPHGILFNPLSVARSINSYIDGAEYTEADLFYLNELWNSWDHHTRFSNTDISAALAGINQSQTEAHHFILNADWVVITLGSAFQYYLKDNDRPVANNHRAPAQWFQKKLLSIAEIETSLTHTLEKLFAANAKVNVLFTISPVRHIRDGVVDNNRSKARLIEAVHNLCQSMANVHYFPAYELVIDVLRDYRFYDVDLVHPNFAATSFVWQHFMKSCISPAIYTTMQQVNEIATARAHRTRFPDTEAHRKFLSSYAAKTKALMTTHPYLNLKDELRYFTAD